MHLWLWKFKENFHFPFYRNVNSNTNKVKFCPPDPVLIFPIIHAITQGYPLVHFVIQRFESDEGDTDSVVDVIADLGRELGPISDGEQREFELLTRWDLTGWQDQPWSPPGGWYSRRDITYSGLSNSRNCPGPWTWTFSKWSWGNQLWVR